MPAAIPKSGWHELVDAIPSVTPATLNALLTEAPEPILVSFQAPGWEALAPASRELVDIFGARLHVVHVDLATYPDLAVRFKIRVIPTLLLFMHGVLTEFIVGMIPTRFLVETLSTALGVRANLNTSGGAASGVIPKGSAGDVS
jgi:thioredoxin-like negative regulator of GroEL